MLLQSICNIYIYCKIIIIIILYNYNYCIITSPQTTRGSKCDDSRGLSLRQHLQMDTGKPDSILFALYPRLFL